MECGGGTRRGLRIKTCKVHLRQVGRYIPVALVFVPAVERSPVLGSKALLGLCASSSDLFACQSVSAYPERKSASAKQCVTRDGDDPNASAVDRGPCRCGRCGTAVSTPLPRSFSSSPA